MVGSQRWHVFACSGYQSQGQANCSVRRSSRISCLTVRLRGSNSIVADAICSSHIRVQIGERGGKRKNGIEYVSE